MKLAKSIAVRKPSITGFHCAAATPPLSGTAATIDSDPVIDADTAPGSGHVDASTVHGPRGAALVLGALAGPATVVVDARPVSGVFDVFDVFDAAAGIDAVGTTLLEAPELEHATTNVPAIPASNNTVRHVNSRALLVGGEASGGPPASGVGSFAHGSIVDESFAS